MRDPRGMFGETLGAHMHVVTANGGAVRTLSTVLERCHLDMERPGGVALRRRPRQPGR
ncbi:MAG: hypothetical protein ACMVO3_22175 [Thalassobaculum sp.]